MLHVEQNVGRESGHEEAEFQERVQKNVHAWVMEGMPFGYSIQTGLTETNQNSETPNIYK